MKLLVFMLLSCMSKWKSPPPHPHIDRKDNSMIRKEVKIKQRGRVVVPIIIQNIRSGGSSLPRVLVLARNYTPKTDLPQLPRLGSTEGAGNRHFQSSSVCNWGPQVSDYGYVPMTTMPDESFLAARWIVATSVEGDHPCPQFSSCNQSFLNAVTQHKVS